MISPIMSTNVYFLHLNQFAGLGGVLSELALVCGLVSLVSFLVSRLLSRFI